MKIKKLEKKLNKIVVKEFGADGYAEIESVEIDRTIDPDGPFITLKCQYGIYGDFYKKIEINYLDGEKLDHIAGMFHANIE